MLPNFIAMKTLLLHIDFSDDSKACFHYAAHLAAQTQSKITVFSAFALDIPAGANLHSYREEIRAEKIRLEREFKKWLSTQQLPNYENNDKSIYIDYHFEKGNFIEEAKKVCSQVKADLFITTAKSKVGEMGIQTNQDHVQLLKHACCPLLIVPSGFQYEHSKRITYAVSLYQEDHELIEKVHNMCAHINAKLQCLHISSRDKNIQQTEQLIQSFRDKMGNRDIPFQHQQSSDILHGLRDYSSQKDCDMLVMLFSEKSFFHKLFHVSKIKDMSTHSAVPLLLAKKTDTMPF
ncbi:MAG: universal stress protein [Cytophagales bacterium]|nr:MAG: universal stress protein [Cytophagales bacterium]TAF61743.1 MAG: universal stress protein [Cytophagales bacterium]